MSPRARRIGGLLTIGLGTAVGPLDTAVNVAFPAITSGFGQPMAMIQWVVICYVLTYASLMLVFGKLGDLLGYRRIFVAGLVLSIAGLALCAAAPSFGWLLLFRGLQGVGTALVLSCGPALATVGVDAERRARVIGAYTMMFAIASAVGPLAGGFLVELFGWRAVFWARLPIAALALALIGLVGASEARPAARRFDWAGAILLVAGLVSLLLALNMARPGGGAAAAIGLGLLAAAGFAGFAWREATFAEPLIRLGHFRSPEFTLVNLASIAVFLVNFAVLLLVPYYLARLTPLSVTTAGLVLASGFADAVLAAPVAGRLAARVGSQRVGFAGAWLVAIGSALIGLWQPDTPMWLMLAELLLSGIGVGLFQVAYMDVVLGRLPAADRGVAGSLAMLTRTVGVVTGVTVLTLAFETLNRGGAAAGLPPDPAFLAAFQTTFLGAGGALAGFLLLSLVRPRTWL
jgi:EmrB/QacA subfamily drug resistance transporter